MKSRKIHNMIDDELRRIVFSKISNNMATTLVKHVAKEINDSFENDYKNLHNIIN